MIGEIIQVALAPVFLLVAIGNMLNLLTVRLGRVVDRSRILQERYGETDGMEHDMVVSEIRNVAKRIDCTNRAILLLVLSGLATGVTVVLLFVRSFIEQSLEAVLAGTFIVSIGLMMTGLIYFLRETREASASLRIPETYLELDRKL